MFRTVCDAWKEIDNTIAIPKASKTFLVLGTLWNLLQMCDWKEENTEMSEGWSMWDVCDGLPMKIILFSFK